MENKFERLVCDRCGSEVIYPTKRILFLLGIGREGGFALCDNCHKELNVWFNDKKENEE